MAVYTHRGPKALYEDYGVIARKLRTAAAIQKALRSQSPDFAELFAYLATNGELTSEHLYQGLKPARWSRDWLYSLARIVAQQDPTADNFALAARLMATLREAYPDYAPPALVQLYAELAVETGDYKYLRELLDTYPTLREMPGDSFMLDFLNPNLNPSAAGAHNWLTALNTYLANWDLQPIALSDSDNLHFEGMTRVAQQSVGKNPADPLVSIIVTCFRPAQALFTHSIFSLLAQTWQNLEIIVVDDASGPDYDDILRKVASLDPRVKVVRQAENRGTYEARNRGFQESSGAFITGHDSDDWAHPQRIERQLAPLLADGTLPGTMSKGIKVDSDLRITHCGRVAVGVCQSTLLIRREVRDLIGDYLPARKAVDTEYSQRVDLLWENSVLKMEEPLEFVLNAVDSLSGAEFLPGWKHPARNVVKESYEYWHRQAAAAPDPVAYLKSTLPSIPNRYQLQPQKFPQFDVVLAGDWQSFGGPQKSMLQEITAHLASGKRVGVLDLEVDRMITMHRRGLNQAVLELMTAGKVTMLLPDDEAETDVLFLRYPPTLQFKRRAPFRLRAKQMAILGNQAPSERDGSDIRYYPEDVDRNAEHVFGVKPLWIPQGPVVRSQIEDVIPVERVATINMPSVVDIADWETDRSTFRSHIPVIGRHSRDNPMKWPGIAQDVLAAYPDSPDVEVRVMGGTRYVKEIIGEIPSNWVDLKKDAVPVREFLASIDFFVFFPHVRAFESFGMAILEALASGCVVILPEHFEDTFGDAALYCEPEEVRGVVAEYYADPEKYRAQSALAVARVKQEFSLEAHLARFHQLLGV